MKKYLPAFLLFFLCSCNFNSLFLEPTKLPSNTRYGTLPLKGKKDSLVVFFSGSTHQPRFTIDGKDTVNMDYTIEAVNFKNANGDTLNGWFLKPKHGKAHITLLHLHGNAGCLLYQYSAIAPLTKDTFQIFMFDYSGFGFSQGASTRANVLVDANSALDYLKARPDVQGTKIVIYGQSLGGHLAAVVGAERQNDIDGLVLEGAFSSAKDIAAHQVPLLGRIFVKQGYSAKRSIKKYHKPLLVIHSTEDQMVPFYMGKKIYKNANQPKEFYQIKKCHMCGPTYYTDSIAIKIKGMVAK